MREYKKVVLETAFEKETLEFDFRKDGGVSITIVDHTLENPDLWERREVDIHEKEWSQFCSFINEDTVASIRKCSKCGETGHNARICNWSPIDSNILIPVIK